MKSEPCQLQWMDNCCSRLEKVPKEVEDFLFGILEKDHSKVKFRVNIRYRPIEEKEKN